MANFTAILALMSQESLYAWLLATLKNPEESEAPGLGLIEHNLKNWQDMEILYSLLSRKLVDSCLAEGISGQMLLSFCLRHQATLVNQALDLKSIGRDVPDFLSYGCKAREIPLIGFSARGLFITTRKLGGCRAFDDLDIPFCNQSAEADSPFCGEHQNESYEAPEKVGSTQAQMRRFYGDPQNLSAYSEVELSSLVEHFFLKLDAFRHRQSQLSVETALGHLGLAGSDLTTMVKSDLQRCFYELCHIHHPDKGGDEKSFHLIKESYETLRAHLRFL